MPQPCCLNPYATAVLLESVNDIYQSYRLLFDSFEHISIFIFSMEYLLRLWSIAEQEPFESGWKNRLKWIKSGGAIIDLLAILPAYINFFVPIDLRFLRILRLLRLLKLTRYFVSLQILLRVIEREKGSFQAVIFILSIMIVMAAACIYVVENKAQPHVFTSIPASMWWAVVTLTTVGYGDVTPITPLGRFLGAQFRELLQHSEIDLVADQEKIEEIRKDVGLTKEQTQDILLQLMREQREEALKQERDLYEYCPHCGKKLPEL